MEYGPLMAQRFHRALEPFERYLKCLGGFMAVDLFACIHAEMDATFKHLRCL